MKPYETVTEALNELNKKGFSVDLNISFDKKICTENKNCLSPQDFEIIETHRFDSSNNPSDEDIIYAISSKDGKIKGTFMEAFGTYADDEINQFILTIKNKRSLRHG
jgi:hypothetical protein